MHLYKKQLMITIGFVLSSLAAPVMALTMSAPDGWYLEGNAGSSHLSNDNLPGQTSSSGIGGSGNLGYKFMPYGGLEMGYSQYATTSVKNTVGTKAAEVKHYSYDIAARAILPISDSGFEAFAKLGVGRIVSTTSIDDEAAANGLGIDKSSHSSTGVYLGVGGQVYFTPEFAVVVQWARAQGSSSSGTEDLFSLGVSFIFV